MAQSKNSGMGAAAGDENGVPLSFFSGDGATPVHPDARTLAPPTKNGTPSIFSGERAATRTNDASQIKTGAPSDVYDSSVEQAAAYSNSDTAAGEALALTSQVFGDETESVPGAFAERLRRGLPVLGLSVASLAVTRLAAGEPTPAAGFGLFLMLIAGLCTVIIRVLGA